MTEERSGNLLIVDDTPENLRLLCDMLGDEGYQLRPFSQPLVALDAARVDPPDLFILDVAMPDMDGYELCEILKKEEATKDVPVIFLSAQRETSNVVKGFQRGAVDYIVKPFQFEEVANRVRTHLNLKFAQAELKARNAELEAALEQLKATQSQLVHSGKMASLGVLTAGVAHEINNPINFVSANASVLRRILRENPPQGDSFSLDLEDYDTLQELADGFEEGSSRIIDIVAGLRVYARVDEDVLKPYNARENIEATLKVFHHELKYNIAVDLDVGEDLVIQANPGKLNQVLANLLSNSIDAVRQVEDRERRIQISATMEPGDGGSRFVMRVGDNGPGIPGDLQARIFDPFFTSRPPGQGLGLGLSITRSIVEAHGGRISVESAPGRTVFTVSMPA